MDGEKDSNYEISGTLLKKGNKGIKKLWKKRWLVLRKNGDALEYYASHLPGERLLGKIELQTITSVTTSKKKFSFRIHTTNRTYAFRGKNEQNVEYFISSINQVVKNKPNLNSSQKLNQSAENISDPELTKLEKKLSENALNDGVKLPQNALLSVTLKRVEELNLSRDKGHLGVYCVLSMEKQLVKIQTINDLKNIEWNETHFFDVTGFDVPSKEQTLTITVWVQDSSLAGGKSLGQNQKITVDIKTLHNKEPVDEMFSLTSTNKSRASGKFHIALNFTPANKKVGKEDFEILNVIGRGNFGKVMQVRKKDSRRIYAMKVLKKEYIIAADAVQHTISESNVLRRIHHPFIVTFKYSFQTDDRLYIVMDYLSGGELFYHLSNVDRFEEERAKFYTAEIIEALGYLHDNNIIYRDLKPENLLLDISGHVCLTDFGLVKEGINYGDVTTTFCGSPEYLAPEVLLGKPYGKDVDWWSLGTFLYEMLQGLPPFYDEDPDRMNKKILSSPLKFDPEIFSPEAKSLISALLQRDPKTRIGSGQTDHKELKAHPFFSSIDWEKLSRKEIEPSFKPHLKNAEDVSYFDTEFTNEIPQETPCNNNGKYMKMAGKNVFNGFSFASSEGEELMHKKFGNYKHNP